jgi:tRNA threonylcarbamoyladenosine dehydratase
MLVCMVDQGPNVDPRFAGIERLYGAGSVARLQSTHVAVVGVGGVGSWAVEALARSGVGTLTMVDADEICVSNVNRQLHALNGSFGQRKVDALKIRVEAIAPGIQVHAIAHFVTPDNVAQLLEPTPDLLLDACDALKPKLALIAHARRVKLPIVVCGAAGGRIDPTLIRVRDLSGTEHDAMLALVRKKLRQDFNFPRNPKRSFGVPAVYSLENVRYPQADGSVCGTRPALGAESSLKLDCGAGLGAATHVTGAFAFAAVGRVLARLLALKSRQLSEIASGAARTVAQ